MNTDNTLTLTLKRGAAVLLLAGCVVMGGVPSRAHGAEGVETPGAKHPLQDMGNCYIALHGLDGGDSYNPYREISSSSSSSPSLSEHWNEALFKAQHYFDYRSAAFEECEEGLEAGDASNGFWLGEYLLTRGKKKEALSYYRKGAEMGDVLSLLFLGIDYARKRGLVRRNVMKGLEYLKRAADAGYGRAQWAYARVYDRGGRSVEIDLPKAWEYYQRAADNGDPIAMVKVGTMYLYYGVSGHHGVSGQCAPEVVKNPNLEARLTGVNATEAEHRAHDAKDKALAREKYAALHITCDEEKGLDYIRQAAMLGLNRAIIMLAYFYEQRGETEEALKWYTLMRKWDYSDMFYIDSAPYSLSVVLYLPKQSLLREYQNVSREYIENARQGGQDEMVAAAEAWAMEMKTNMPAQFCKYNDHSWHYRCAVN